MSWTWKPRLVKTPTPTMSATTIAVATSSETDDPPPVSRPGQAEPPDPDAAMSVHALGYTPGDSPSCRPRPVTSSNVNKDLNRVLILVFWYLRSSREPLQH